MRGRRLALVMAVVAVPAGWVLYAAYASPAPGPTGEVVPQDEDVYTSQIIAAGLRMVNLSRRSAGDGVYRRDAHAKTHGCARATFRVLGADAPYDQGLFAQPKEYKAWIRFSSGNTWLRSDWAPDARGMAIKVLGVPGRKLLEGEEDARTHDFLMIDNPIFFVRDVKEYAELTRFQAEENQFGYFFQEWNPFRWRLREFRIGVGILKFPPKNLLATEFYSMTAYALGARDYVKYSAKPVPCEGSAGVPARWIPFGGDGLGENLAIQLQSQRAYCFDLRIQRQDPARMPVEDSTVEWSEGDAPFVAVARIKIETQDIRRYREFCENLSMTPWHALTEHRPVGGMNRVRKAVYQAIARYRRCKNGVAFGEPKEDGTPEFESRPCDPHAPVPAIRQPPPS